MHVNILVILVTHLASVVLDASSRLFSISFHYFASFRHMQECLQQTLLIGEGKTSNVVSLLCVVWKISSQDASRPKISRSNSVLLFTT